MKPSVSFYYFSGKFYRQSATNNLNMNLPFLKYISRWQRLIMFEWTNLNIGKAFNPFVSWSMKVTLESSVSGLFAYEKWYFSP